MSLNGDSKQNKLDPFASSRDDDDDVDDNDNDDDDDDYEDNIYICNKKNDTERDNEDGNDDDDDDDDDDNLSNHDDDDDNEDEDEDDDYINSQVEQQLYPERSQKMMMMKKKKKQKRVHFAPKRNDLSDLHGEPSRDPDEESDDYDGYLRPNDQSWTTRTKTTTTATTTPAAAAAQVTTATTTTTTPVNRRNNDRSVAASDASSRLNNLKRQDIQRPTSDLHNDLESSGATARGSYTPSLPIFYISNPLNINNNNNNNYNSSSNVTSCFTDGANKRRQHSKNTNSLQARKGPQMAGDGSGRSRTLPSLLFGGQSKGKRCKKIGFKECSPFAKDLEDQFKASKNCHSTRPALKFDETRRRLVKRNLCGLFSTILCVNITIGIAAVLMTTYVVYHKAKVERSKTEVELRTLGLKMVIASPVDDSAGQLRTITEWGYYNSTHYGSGRRVDNGSANLIDAVHYDNTTGHFQVQIDGFYHVFSRIYFAPSDALIKVRLQTFWGNEEGMESTYVMPQCSQNPSNECLRNTISTVLYLKKGHSLCVQTSNGVSRNMESFLFLHVI